MDEVAGNTAKLNGSDRSDPTLAAVFDHIQSALRGLKFGHISLIVQDGRVVQVDRFEKVRLPELQRR